MKNKVLVTGAAGFIGFHLSNRLLQEGYDVTGLDNMNSYYEVSLKEDRLSLLQEYPDFRFLRLDLADRKRVQQLFSVYNFDYVVHLAAQAGVRYSIQNPEAYIDSNIVGFANVLEGCRHNDIRHLIFASSSSVYGANRKLPYSVEQSVDHPVSLYAATKKSNELMAHTYASLYGLPVTGLRFFTVYGPWGRPDMAYYKFTNAILEGRTIDVYNYGNMMRDFTYVDDIVEGMLKLLERQPRHNAAWSAESPSPSISYAPYHIYNIGNNNPVNLLEFIQILEGMLGVRATKNLKPMQPGDVKETYANIEDLYREIGFQPSVTIQEGLEQFVNWYTEYYYVSELHPV